MIFLFCVVPYAFVSMFFTSKQNSVSASAIDLTSQAIVSDLVDNGLTQISLSNTPTVIPSVTFMPSPSPTVVSSPTLSLSGVYMDFRLSFYDPKLGGANCFEWSYELNDCISKVNQGTDDYKIWYKRGAACPPPLRIGQVFIVHQPLELRDISPYWICIDRGGAIVEDLLDFMIPSQDIWTDDINSFPWLSHVQIELVR